MASRMGSFQCGGLTPAPTVTRERMARHTCRCRLVVCEGNSPWGWIITLASTPCPFFFFFFFLLLLSFLVYRSRAFAFVGTSASPKRPTVE